MWDAKKIFNDRAKVLQDYAEAAYEINDAGSDERNHEEYMREMHRWHHIQTCVVNLKHDITHNELKDRDIENVNDDTDFFENRYYEIERFFSKMSDEQKILVEQNLEDWTTNGIYTSEAKNRHKKMLELFRLFK